MFDCVPDWLGTNSGDSLMTLNIWQERNNVKATPFREAMYLPDDVPNRESLWSLTDYRVSSVSCGTIWLMPRK